jgi:endonuclease YncB( thermonuclease family)
MLIEGQRVRRDVLGRDRCYRRALSTCGADDVELNSEMVRLGWALAFYPARDVQGSIYDAEEADAEVASGACGRARLSDLGNG